jgi:hypothetical protein
LDFYIGCVCKHEKNERGCNEIPNIGVPPKNT